MRRTVLLWLLLAALTLLIAQQFEYVEQPVHRLPAVKPGAAAVRLMANNGKENRRIIHTAELFPLPDVATLVILNRQHGRLAAWQQQALLEWVSLGGTLVVNALPLDADAYDAGELDSDSIARHDPLLYALGITSWQRHHDQGRDPVMQAWELLAEYNAGEFGRLCSDSLGEAYDTCIRFACGDIEQWPDYALLESGNALYQFELDPAIDLLHQDLFADSDINNELTPNTDSTVVARAGSTDRDQLLGLTLGAGEAWVLSDLAIFSNERLHHLDHAWLLYALSNDAETVYWSQNIDAPPLLIWLWQRAWPLFLSLTLLLILFIWQHLPRRTTLLDAQDSRHADFTAHLQAAAALLWRHGDRQALLQPLRDEILARTDGPVPSDSWLARASEESGYSKQQLRQALNQVPADQTALIEIVSILQRLRQR